MVKSEQAPIEIELVALHPEIIGSQYAAASIYLLTKHNLFDKSMRDRFTAGGRVTSVINGRSCNYSRIITWVIKHWTEVKEYLRDNKDLFFVINSIEPTCNIVQTWINMANDAFEKSRNSINVDGADKSLKYFLTKIL